MLGAMVLQGWTNEILKHVYENSMLATEKDRVIFIFIPNKTEIGDNLILQPK